MNIMITFYKMHALGNHFIFIDEFEYDISYFKNPKVIRFLCDYNKGIGGDGVVFLQKPKDLTHHCRMQIFNADGSEAEMCGNAIRGAAHLFRKHQLGETQLLIETLSGPRLVSFEYETKGTSFYKVEMGKPIFDLVATGELLPANERKTLEWQGETLEPFYANFGNPHLMLFLNSPMSRDEMIALGAWLETHPNHPRRINVEFVEIKNPSEANVTVWERGCGMTQACGTGATAVAAVGIKRGLLSPPVTIHMPGGDLIITKDDKDVYYKTGPIQEIYSGILTSAFITSLRNIIPA